MGWLRRLFLGKSESSAVLEPSQHEDSCLTAHPERPYLYRRLYSDSTLIIQTRNPNCPYKFICREHIQDLADKILANEINIDQIDYYKRDKASFEWLEYWYKQKAIWRAGSAADGVPKPVRPTKPVTDIPDNVKGEGFDSNLPFISDAEPKKGEDNPIADITQALADERKKPDPRDIAIMEEHKKHFQAEGMKKRPAPYISRSEQIEKAFSYVAPKMELDQPGRYIELRIKAKQLAYKIDEHCPESREKAMALTKLEEVIMWANAAIARNE